MTPSQWAKVLAGLEGRELNDALLMLSDEDWAYAYRDHLRREQVAPRHNQYLIESIKPRYFAWIRESWSKRPNLDPETLAHWKPALVPDELLRVMDHELWDSGFGKTYSTTQNAWLHLLEAIHDAATGI